MKRNNVLSYSFIPQNAISITDISNVSNVSNVTNTNTNLNVVNIYTKTINTNVDNYSSEYGIPFECLEFIRRFFATQCKYTFPSVIDAEDMFYTINALTHTSNQYAVALKTYQYPYGDENDVFNCLKPGNILFWKKTNSDDFKYGHVALIISANESHVRIANQNVHPYIKTYNTRELIQTMNRENSPFLGIKVIPTKISEILEPKMNNIKMIHH